MNIKCDHCGTTFIWHALYNGKCPNCLRPYGSLLSLTPDLNEVDQLRADIQAQREKDKCQYTKELTDRILAVGQELAVLRHEVDILMHADRQLDQFLKEQKIKEETPDDDYLFIPLLKSDGTSSLHSGELYVRVKRKDSSD